MNNCIHFSFSTLLLFYTLGITNNINNNDAEWHYNVCKNANSVYKNNSYEKRTSRIILNNSQKDNIFFDERCETIMIKLVKSKTSAPLHNFFHMIFL